MEALKPYQIASIVIVCMVVAVLLLLGNPSYTKTVIQNGFMRLETVAGISESRIYVYQEGNLVLYFTPWEMKVTYDGQDKRIFNQNSDKTYFNGRDSKRVEVEGDSLVITYFNETKDPRAISIAFTLEGGVLEYKIIANVSKPEKLEEIAYGYRFEGLGYEKILTPDDDVIETEGGGSYTFSGLQIPEVERDYQLMVSNKTAVKVKGEFNSIWNSPKWQTSMFQTKVGGALYISLQEPKEIETVERGLYISYDNRISENDIKVYWGGKNILRINPWEMKMNYGGAEKRVFGYDSEETYFNGRDSKRVEVEVDRVTITYFNENKDPRAISTMFKIDGEVLEYDIIADVSEPEKIESISYAYVFGGLGYGAIITPGDDVIKNRGKESYVYQRMRIPIVSKDYQVMISKYVTLKTSGDFDRIENSLRWQTSLFETGLGEGLKIEVQEPSEVRVPKDRLHLTFGEGISNNDIYLYDDAERILHFTPWEMKLRYRGGEKRVFGYDSEDTYFNGLDSKRVETGEDWVAITYSNEMKDPGEITIVFKLDGGTLNYRIDAEVSKPWYLEGFFYGYRFDGFGYDEIITPTGDVIENAGEGSYFYRKPREGAVGYQLMSSNERILNVSGDFDFIENSLRWQTSWLGVGTGESVDIKVEVQKRKYISEDDLYLSAEEGISDNYIHFYDGAERVLFFTPWDMRVKYQGAEKRVFGYDGEETYFNGLDSKTVWVGGDEMAITYFNKDKDPRSISIEFELEGDTLYYGISAEVMEPEALERLAYGYGFDGLGYDEVVLPSGEVIEADGNESYSRRKSESENWVGRLLMRAGGREVGISGEYDEVWYSQKWQTSLLYTEPGEWMYISV